MSFRRSVAGRLAAGAVAALLAAAAFAGSASADHNLLEQVSTGPAGGNGAIASAEYRGASSDGLRVFFYTVESLVSADSDTSWDVYERSGGQTTLVSTGPAGGNGDFDAPFAGASADGTRVFFHTEESLVVADTDTRPDVHERSGGQTTLVSTRATSAARPSTAATASATA
jgi:hypothetical protein